MTRCGPVLGAGPHHQGVCRKAVLWVGNLFPQVQFPHYATGAGFESRALHERKSTPSDKEEL